MISSPVDLSGLQLWLDGTQETAWADGAPVTTWTDRSGNGRHATGPSGTAPLAALDSVTNQRVLLFDGSKGLTIPSGWLSTAAGTTIVATALVDDGPRYALSASDVSSGRNRYRWYMMSNNRNSLRFAAGDDVYTNVGGLGVNIPGSEWARMTAWHGRRRTVDQAIDASHLCRNGQYDSAALGSLSLTGTASNQVIGVGQYLGAITQAWVGTIGEIIHYGRALTDLELQDVYDYLKLKWLLRCTSGWSIGKVGIGPGAGIL